MNRPTHRKNKLNIPNKKQFLYTNRDYVKKVKKPILNRWIQSTELTILELDVLYNTIIIFETITLLILVFNSNKRELMYASLTLIITSILSYVIKSEKGIDGELKKESTVIILCLSILSLLFPHLSSTLTIAISAMLIVIVECIFSSVINNKNSKL